MDGKRGERRKKKTTTERMKDQQIEQICQNIDGQTVNPLMCRCVNKYPPLSSCSGKRDGLGFRGLSLALVLERSGA